MGEVEGVRLKGFLVRDFIKEEFLKKIQENKVDVEPIALVFLDKDVKQLTLATLNHQSPKEVEDKILHIQSQNEKLLEGFTNAIEGKLKK